MSAFRKMFNVLRSNKTGSSELDMRAISDRSLPSTFSGNTRPSVYSFRYDYDMSRRVSAMSTISDATHINYANELSNWRQPEPVLGMSSPGSTMMPGYLGQYGYTDPYAPSMSYPNSNYGYPPLVPENQMMLPENPIFPDHRIIGSDNPFSHMSAITESRSRFPSVRSDAFRSNMVSIPLDKLKRMRAAKDLYNVLNYLDSDDTFLKKPNKSSKSKRSSKKLF